MPKWGEYPPAPQFIDWWRMPDVRDRLIEEGKLTQAQLDDQKATDEARYQEYRRECLRLQALYHQGTLADEYGEANYG